jgi:hypothetical protein
LTVLLPALSDLQITTPVHCPVSLRDTTFLLAHGISYGGRGDLLNCGKNPSLRHFANKELLLNSLPTTRICLKQVVRTITVISLRGNTNVVTKVIRGRHAQTLRG